MKKIMIALIILLCTSLAHPQWTKYTLTSGNIDKNPTFTSEFYGINSTFYSNWEFLTFERHTGSNSQIMVGRLGQNGFEAIPEQLTTNPSLKKNPAIGTCYTESFPYGSIITSALILWEDNKNGKWDIYASAYLSSSGWSAPFPFDSTSGNKSSPKLIGKDSVIFYIVYEKSGDIIYREFNARTKTVLVDTNITADISQQCGNPYIVTGYSTQYTKFISFERLKPDTTKAIYVKSKSSTGWTTADTTAYLGNNINNGFAPNVYTGVDNVFSSNRTGNYVLYHTRVSPVSSNPQSTVFSYNQPTINYTNYQYFFYPIITDGLYANIQTYITTSDSMRLNFNYPYFPHSPVTLGNPLTTNTYSLSSGLFAGNYSYKTWLAYTKDSLGFKNLYGLVTAVYLGGVKKTGNEIPEKYSLEQNYPNPFNSSSNIKFQIINAGRVKLVVFDLLGREVKTLVNEELQPGKYHVSFDASSLSSGIYFYRMEAGDFNSVKKLIMLK